MNLTKINIYIHLNGKTNHHIWSIFVRKRTRTRNNLSQFKIRRNVCNIEKNTSLPSIIDFDNISDSVDGIGIDANEHKKISNVLVKERKECVMLKERISTLRQAVCKAKYHWREINNQTY